MARAGCRRRRHAASRRMPPPYRTLLAPVLAALLAILAGVVVLGLHGEHRSVAARALAHATGHLPRASTPRP